MGNLNFALFTAAYLYAVGWIFTRTKSIETLVVFGLALSPLVALGLALQGRSVRQDDPDSMPQNAWVSHILALAASVGLIVFVNWILAREGTIWFFMDYLKGWTLDDAIILLLISVAMGASALAVWTSYRFRMARNRFMKEDAPYVFFAGVPEVKRILLYAYILAFAWSLGVAAVAVAWRSEGSISVLILKMSRASLPVAIMLVVAMFRLPFMGIGVAASCAGVWYLAAANTSPGRATVFVGVPLAALAVYFAVKSILISSARGSLAGASTAAVEKTASPESGNGEPEKEKKDIE